eukprot:1160836-Pelagomonas_calceolata.AAC.8
MGCTRDVVLMLHVGMHEGCGTHGKHTNAKSAQSIIQSFMCKHKASHLKGMSGKGEARLRGPQIPDAGCRVARR